MGVHDDHQHRLVLAGLTQQARIGALIAAAIAGPASGRSPADLIKFADQLLPYIASLRMVVTISPITYTQGSSASEPTRYIGGDQSMATMKDTQQFVASIKVEDSKGFVTTDANALTWSADDGGAVVTPQPAADGLSCTFVAVAPGTANYQITDGTLTGGGTITVTPGDAEQIAVSEGDPTDQAA